MLTTKSEDLKNAAIEKEQQAHESKIAKPDGQAGRRSGYRLEMAMGVESDHFLRLLVRKFLFFYAPEYMRLIISQRLVRVYASIYLDIRLSISEQGKTKLQLAKAKVITGCLECVKAYKFFFLHRYQPIFPFLNAIKVFGRFMRC
jgi:hypothetical protein